MRQSLEAPPSLDCHDHHEYQNARKYLGSFSDWENLSPGYFEKIFPVLMKDSFVFEIHISQSNFLEITVSAPKKNQDLFISLFIPEELDEFSNYLERSKFVVRKGNGKVEALSFYNEKNNRLILYAIQSGIRRLLKERKRT
jgi:hypothetical protein